jgi:two-component system response regulator AtoC
LRNAVERSLLTCSGNTVAVGDLPEKVNGRSNRPDVATPALEELDEQGLDAWLQDAERRLITAALNECQGVQAQAARRLGISERSLWHRLKKLDIQIERSIRS